MGVDCRILLPNNVRLDDVAKVIGVLAGKVARKEPLSDGSYYCQINGVETKPCSSVAECAEINVDGPLSEAAAYSRNGELNIYCLYHFEPDGGKGRLLMPRSTAFWIAIGRGLVKFFGGSVDYSDCGERGRNFTRPWKSGRENCPSANKPWAVFQDRLLALKPLTKKDFINADKVAAYKIREG